MKKPIKKIKLAVLIGGGGRLPAIYKCMENDPLVDLVIVVSHKKEAPGINLAKRWGVESIYFRLSDWRGTRVSYEKALVKILKEKRINLVVMAGWDLIMSNEFLKHFPNQVMNIHPSLCPAFPGMNSDKQAFDYGAKVTGCTLHFADSGLDTGPIILQRSVEIKSGSAFETFQKKLHKEEEKILCQGIKLFARGRLKIKGKKVISE